MMFVDCDLPVKTVSAIHRVQDVYKADFDHKSVAQELIQNSLTEKQNGDIHIRRNLILLEVNGEDQQSLTEIEEKVNNGVIYAKKCFTDKSERLRSLDEPQKDSKSHGRGFLLMFCLGWDIITLQKHNKLLIAAIKV